MYELLQQFVKRVNKIKAYIQHFINVLIDKNDIISLEVVLTILGYYYSETSLVHATFTQLLLDPGYSSASWDFKI